MSSAYWLNVIETEKAHPEWAEGLFKQNLASSMKFWRTLSFILIFMSLSTFLASILSRT